MHPAAALSPKAFAAPVQGVATRPIFRAEVALQHLGISQNRGDPNIDPKITINLIIGAPKRVPLILGNPYIDKDCKVSAHFLFHLILHYSRYPLILGTPIYYV